MDMEFTSGPTGASIKATGTKTKSLGMVSTTGKMAVLIKGTGMKIICMEREFMSGQMEGPTRASTSTTRSKVLESTPIPMADPTKESGSMVSSMERESSSLLKELRGKVCGQRERECGG
jgi:hypothetical protein